MHKNLYLLFALLLMCVRTPVQAQSCSVSAVYGGGPFYKLPATTVPELRASGFTTAIIWTIHIDTAGNFNYNAEFPIVANGQYIGYQTHPDFAHNVALLKTAPTSINRVEAGISAAGSSTFQNIKNQIAAHGTGPTTNLYKNFKALKDSIPQIDAINFDDESTYDVSSSVQLAVMLAGLGYKVALCPYTNAAYWKSVASQTNAQAAGTVDAIFLQCYDGGAGNSPCNTTWNFGGIPVYPGLWDSNYPNPANVQTKMSAWKTQCGITGGFMWLYDDFKNTPKTAQYAAAINAATGAQASAPSPAASATNVSTQPSLSWTAAACAQSHNVYFGTANPPAFVRNQAAATYSPGSLQANTTYYWRIDEQGAAGTVAGAVWSFTTGTSTGIGALPAGAGIGEAFPNPFSGQTRLDAAVAAGTGITCVVTDLYGHQVYTARGSASATGSYTLVWDGRNDGGQPVASGVYFIRVLATDAAGTKAVANRKVVFVRP